MIFPSAIFLFSSWLSAVAAAVLDPSLHLSPGPPLLPSGDEVPAAERWTQTLADRAERDLAVVPLEKESEPTPPPESEAMQEAETFWPFRSNYEVRSIHLPLTFAVSGNYGGYGTNGNAGLISSSYGVLGTAPGLYGRLSQSAFAGSAYSGAGLVGTRIYGNPAGSIASWSGWGNGKWGHYGKG